MDPTSTSLLLISDRANRSCLAIKRIYQSCDYEDAKKNVISDKKNTHFHAKTFGFGDFEQTQNTTVFLATAQQIVALRVKANM